MGVKLKSIYYNLLLWSHAFLNRIHILIKALSSLGSLSIITLLFLEFAFHLERSNISIFFYIHVILITFFTIEILLNIFIFSKSKWSFIISNPLDTLVILAVAYAILTPQISISFFMTQCLLFIILTNRISKLNLFLKWLKIQPTQIIILGFIFVIFIGALLLSLPIASSTSIPLSFIDAFFTACSAVCVTGLSINSIGQDLTMFGQVIVLLLIQIGGLGIMSFSVLLILILKQKVSQSDTIRLQENYATVDLKETFSAISFIFKFTFFFEALGAFLLAIFWHNQDIHISTTLFYAIFHSISAFCNAGFTLFSNSLVDFQFHTPTLIIISVLIIVGGLGFPILFNLFQHSASSSSLPLKIQTRLALTVTVALIFIGGIFILLTESNHSLANYSFSEKCHIAFFQSVTTRTAGFHTFDLNLFHPSSIMTCILLMIIGASPASTGGGIKTTTFGLIILSFWNILKSSFRFDFNKKTIDQESILRAFATLFTALIIIFIFSFFLFQIETTPVHKLLFEVISAFGTVGLSLGITPFLSTTGKILIMITMFIGRIGPFVFLYAFFRQYSTKKYAYPVEKVNIV